MPEVVRDTPSTRTSGVALVAVSAASFGALGVLARLAYDDGASPVGVLTCRFGIAALCFAALWVARGRPRVPRATFLGLTGMGLCYLVQSLCYFSAVDHAPPGLVALLLYSYPALVVVGSTILLSQPLTRRVTAACVAAVAGVALIAGPSMQGGDVLGFVFGIGAAFVYAGYILAGSRILRGADALTASTVIMSTAALGFAILFVGQTPRPSLPQSAKGWLAIVAVAVLCTVVAGITFLAGLARVGPAAASMISTLEPVVSVALAAAVLDESLTLWALAGGSLVVASVVAIARTTRITPP